jgi:hypothetical protein
VAVRVNGTWQDESAGGIESTLSIGCILRNGEQPRNLAILNDNVTVEQPGLWEDDDCIAHHQLWARQLRILKRADEHLDRICLRLPASGESRSKEFCQYEVKVVIDRVEGRFEVATEDAPRRVGDRTMQVSNSPRGSVVTHQALSSEKLNAVVDRLWHQYRSRLRIIRLMKAFEGSRPQATVGGVDCCIADVVFVANSLEAADKVDSRQ